MSKFGRKQKQAPDGFEYVEPTLTALEQELRERKYLSFPHEFILLDFTTENMSCLPIGVNDPHEGLRKTESQWPIHQINWQKSRYIYDLYYTFNRISKEVYDYCINTKIIDAALIAKWKKPGYERLCSTYVINPRNYKFGTVSICRVPKQFLAPGTEIEDPITGCRGCASDSSHNIFGNKYGQYLAAVQIAREEKQARKAALLRAQQMEHLRQQQKQQQQQLRQQAVEEEEEVAVQQEVADSDEDEEAPVTEADGSHKKSSQLWANPDKESKYELTEDMIGQLAPDAKREAMAAAAKVDGGNKHSASSSGDMGPPGKRVRPN